VDGVCVLQAAPCDPQLTDNRNSSWSMPAEPLQSPRLISSTADPDDPDVRFLTTIKSYSCHICVTAIFRMAHLHGMRHLKHYIAS